MLDLGFVFDVVQNWCPQTIDQIDVSELQIFDGWDIHE